MSDKKMKLSAFVLFAALAAAGCAQQPQTPLHEGVILKQDPEMGTLPTGMTIYVDDGSCPAGQIKKLIGGSVSRNIPRDVRCVKRP